MSKNPIEELALLAQLCPCTTPHTHMRKKYEVRLPPLHTHIVELYGTLNNHCAEFQFGEWILLSAAEARKRYDDQQSASDENECVLVEFAKKSLADVEIKAAYDPKTKRVCYLGGSGDSAFVSVDSWIRDALDSAWAIRKSDPSFEIEEAWLKAMKRLDAYLEDEEDLPAEGSELGTWLDTQMCQSRKLISKRRNDDFTGIIYDNNTNAHVSWTDLMYNTWWMHVERNARLYLPSPSSTWLCTLEAVEEFIRLHNRLPLSGTREAEPSDAPEPAADVAYEARLRRWINIQRKTDKAGSWAATDLAMCKSDWDSHTERYSEFY